MTENSTYKIDELNRTLNIPDSFLQILKNGIYKELHRQQLLTDTQLNILLREK